MCKYILQTNVVKYRYTIYTWLCVFVRGLLQFVVHTYTPWNALQGTSAWTTQQICWIVHTWRPQNALGAGGPWTTNCRNPLSTRIPTETSRTYRRYILESSYIMILPLHKYTQPRIACISAFYTTVL